MYRAHTAPVPPVLRSRRRCAGDTEDVHFFLSEKEMNQRKADQRGNKAAKPTRDKPVTPRPRSLIREK